MVYIPPLRTPVRNFVLAIEIALSHHRRIPHLPNCSTTFCIGSLFTLLPSEDLSARVHCF